MEKVREILGMSGTIATNGTKLIFKINYNPLAKNPLATIH
jgi:hypothetical protein